MDTNSILDRVREIVADATLTSVRRVAEETSTENLDRWDSIAQINIIIGIESEFGISFDVEQIHSLNSVRKLRSAVEHALALPAAH
jgi:acyl carrier protein